MDRPYTLTATQGKNPHRNVVARLGRMSHLEYSFSRGNLDEIAWWIQEGVVAEALAGNAKSRRNYTLTLMDYFTVWLSNRQIGSLAEEKAITQTLNVLWEGGAQAHADRYGSWLARVVAYPLADTLLAKGVDPWSQPTPVTLKPTGKGLVGHQTTSEHNNAVEAGMTMVARYLSQWRDRAQPVNTELGQLNTLVERVDRMLGMATTPSRAQLRRLLGVVVRGGVGAEIGKAIRGKSETDRPIEDQWIRTWRRWRDELLARGAPVIMGGGDALETLITEAPHKPLSRWQVNSITYEIKDARRRESMEIQGRTDWWSVPLPELSKQELEDIMLDAVGRRALAWQRTSHAWLDSFDSALRRPLTDEDKSILNYSGASRLGRRWGTVLDSPGGMEMAVRLGATLLELGHPLPWTPSTSDPARHDTTFIDLLCVDNRRSTRRLSQVLSLLNEPTLTQQGVSPVWRAGLARNFLRAVPLSDTPDDTVPGLSLQDENYSVSLIQRTRDMIILPTPLEMNLLIDLAGPDVLKQDRLSGDQKEPMNWLCDFMKALPGAWELARTREEDRAALLNVLVERGVVTKLLETATPLSEARLEENTVQPKEAQDAFNLTASWYTSWVAKPADLVLLDRALAEGTQANERTVLARLMAWTEVLIRKPVQFNSEKSVEPTIFTQCLTQESSHSPRFLNMLALVACGRITSHNRDDGWSALKEHIETLSKVLHHGWTPNDENDPTEPMVKALAQLDVDEGQQHVLLDVLGRLAPLHEVGGFLLTALVEEERKGWKKPGWRETVDLLIAAGACPTLPGGAAQPGTLWAHVSSGVTRRELAQVARQAGERPDEPTEEARPKPRF